MKLSDFILVIFIVAVGVALAVYFGGRNKRATQTVVVSILDQIPHSCLVLQTAEEITVSHVRGGSILLGPRCGMGTAVRRTHWGLNLAQIKGGDIDVNGQEVHVRLPDPVVFDTVVDMGSFKYLTRRSGLQAIADVVSGQSLFSELADGACETPPAPSPEQIHARRSEFVRRMNEQAAALFEAKDLNVTFQ